MHPNRRPSDDRLQDSESRPQSSSNNAPASRSLRTFVSRSSLHAPSFHATEDAGTEAFPFPELSEQTSASQQTPYAPYYQQRRHPSTTSQDQPDLYRISSRNPSIRIRRRSNASLQAPSQRSSVTESILENADDTAPPPLPGQPAQVGRARSVSQPERTSARTDPTALARHSRALPQVAMPRLTEEGARPTMDELGFDRTPPLERTHSPAATLPEMPTEQHPRQLGRVRRMSKFFWPGGRNDDQQLPPPDPAAAAAAQRNAEYDDELVDYLDTVDPEVQTLSTLTNIQNSLFVPDLGHWVNRRPTYVLSDIPRVPDEEARISAAEREKEQPAADAELIQPSMERTNTISSRLTESHYAALPHGTTLEGWSAADKEELDDHVRHMLHSRRAKFKRRMKGFGQYVRRPLGFLVTLYATLITLFGLAWVLFLIGWIYVGEKQVYAIHIIDSVLVALFAIVGDGLAPFRAIDTYRMIYIWRYTRIIENAKKGKLPKQRCKLKRKSMPPEDREALDHWHSIDMSRAPPDQQQQPLEAPKPAHVRSSDDIAPDETPDDFPREATQTSNDTASPDLDDDDKREHDPLWPLTPAQQKKFQHQQTKLAKSHSFYKPHETGTHYSFPLAYLIAIVILLDCHSCLQISLGATTWGIDYRTRPIAITTVILCVSISCNIAAGLVITIGDRKTRKKEVHRLMNRQELTGDAIKKIDKRRNKESKERLSSSNNSNNNILTGGSSSNTVTNNNASETTSSSRKTSWEFGRRSSPRAGKLTKDQSK